MASTGTAGRRWTLAAMTAALTLVFLDQTAVSVALPSIRRDLGATHAELAWVMNAFLLTLAALAAAGGRLGDLAGRSRVLIGGVVLFGLASLACGLAPSEGSLIAARAVQGAGAAAMMPTTTAIVADTFPKAERGRALGIYIGVASLFLSIGPLLGGALSEFAGWRWIFFVNLPVAAATVVITLRHVGAARLPFDRAGLDVAGGAMLVGGLGAVVLAVMQGRVWGWTSPAILGLLAGGGLLLALFARFESRRTRPIIPLGLLGDRVYLAATVVVFCARFVTVGGLVLSAIYLQDELGFGALQAGVAMLPATISMLLIAPAGGALTDRLGARLCTIAGMVLLAASLLVLGLLAPAGRYAQLSPGLAGFGVGVGLVTVATSTAGMDVAASGERGQAAGLLATARQVGGTVGLAVMGAVFTAAAATQGPGRPAIGVGLEAALLVAAAVCAVATLAAIVLLRGRAQRGGLRVRSPR